MNAVNVGLEFHKLSFYYDSLRYVSFLYWQCFSTDRVKNWDWVNQMSIHLMQLLCFK